jgi:RNA polymerase sigma-70 factor (ECF subfamily)
MLGRDADLARDKVHDLFMKLLESPSRFDPERKFSVWLFSVASNMCKNEYRSWEVQKRALESGESGPAWTPAAQMEENQPGQKAGLDRAIGELPPAQKEAVVLYYREGLRVNEIAGIMGCSEGTVKSRLFYALKKLGDKLQSTTS